MVVMLVWKLVEMKDKQLVEKKVVTLVETLVC